MVAGSSPLAVRHWLTGAINPCGAMLHGDRRKSWRSGRGAVWVDHLPTSPIGSQSGSTGPRSLVQ